MEAPPKIPLGPRLQEIIHRFEVGAGAKLLKWGLLVLAAITLFVGYNWRAYKNMATQEAMDAAQLARNIAEGRGYSTLFIRPLSIYLLTNQNGGQLGAAASKADPARLNKNPHPDLANPPVYPFLLAGLMKVLPFSYDIPGAGVVTLGKGEKYFWNKDGRFWWYPPDFLIAIFNQLLFLVAVVLTYKLAQRLFDVWVAWLSAILLLGTELLWRFSVSGLSTMLLLVIFLGVAWCLTLTEQAVREQKWGANTPMLLSAAVGLLTGLGGLTRYAFGWLILPVILFLVLFSGQRRVVNALAALAVFAAVMTPWAVRNQNLCGVPFGTATYTVMENTPVFPAHRLQRSLELNLKKYNIGFFWQKLLVNSREVVSTDLPKLGGSWVSAFFLVGLIFAYKSPAINRLRFLLLFCLPVLAVVQALGRTQLWEEVPEINSENLLVLLAPLVVVFGVSFFFALLDQIELAILQLRYAIIGLFTVAACLPMILVFLPPRLYPIAYPPYYPPYIQMVSNWMKEPELMMSDVPWAVAWYGRHQCIWLTMDAQQEYLAVNDYIKPIQALYLTPRTTDSRLLSQWLRTGELSWAKLVLSSIVLQEVPPQFPLHAAPTGFLPEQLFLTDRNRWGREPGS